MLISVLVARWRSGCQVRAENLLEQARKTRNFPGIIRQLLYVLASREELRTRRLILRHHPADSFTRFGLKDKILICDMS
jgi:hypothetical protein